VEISLGISTTDELKKGEGEKELIQKADSRLYLAKQSPDFPYHVSRVA
jgi:PleD family two-component response regulator